MIIEPDTITVAPVIRLRADRFPVETGRTKRPGPACFHRHSYVDSTARTVTCATCSVALDPITVLDQIARDSTWVQVMRAEKKRLVEQIAALKHDVSLVKQQRRRVGP